MALKKKVAYITHKPPFPIVDGGSLAVNKLLLQLLNQDIALTSYFIETPKHTLDPSLPTEIIYKEVPINTTINPISAFFDLLVKKNIQYSRFTRVPKEIELLETDPDLVIVDGLWAFPMYEKYFKGIPFVLRSHNIENEVSKEQLGIQGSFLRFQSKSLAKIEKYVIDQASSVWCISKRDQEKIAQLNTTPAEILPVNMTIRPAIASTENIIRLGFIGAMNWGPNKEAINWILEELLPKLNPERYELHIAGEGAPAVNSQVKVVNHGYISDTSEFYDHIDISLAPIFSGSGVKIKVLEALSHGVPVVATDKGIEGLISPQDSGIVVSSPETFHKAVTHLHSDQQTWQKVKSNSLTYIEKYYSDQAVQKKLTQLIDEVI